MRRMYSENQLIELIQKYGGDIEKIKEELKGSFVQIYDGDLQPNTTLDEETLAMLYDGMFQNGQLKLSANAF